MFGLNLYGLRTFFSVLQWTDKCAFSVTKLSITSFNYRHSIGMRKLKGAEKWSMKRPLCHFLLKNAAMLTGWINSGGTLDANNIHIMIHHSGNANVMQNQIVLLHKKKGLLNEMRAIILFCSSFFFFLFYILLLEVWGWSVNLSRTRT